MTMEYLAVYAKREINERLLNALLFTVRGETKTRRILRFFLGQSVFFLMTFEYHGKEREMFNF